MQLPGGGSRFLSHCQGSRVESRGRATSRVPALSRALTTVLSSPAVNEVIRKDLSSAAILS